MNYICSVENKLGPLNFCRIWHDNSGTGKSRSWFLDQIECTDLQTGERSVKYQNMLRSVKTFSNVNVGQKKL